MKIAAIQMRSGLEPEANLAALEPLLAEAAAAGAQYVLTPEVTMIFAENREELARVAAPFEGHPQLRAGRRTGPAAWHPHPYRLAGGAAAGWALCQSLGAVRPRWGDRRDL